MIPQKNVGTGPIVTPKPKTDEESKNIPVGIKQTSYGIHGKPAINPIGNKQVPSVQKVIIKRYACMHSHIYIL